ncbi:hypothetical protein [Rhizobium leguminosarum]|uniref:hypothetical protein n=1 Tax=Rhizobium leguminosarum TaxID=384 RepID=UPI001AEA35C3|nr:hypothetical protein [Rhizobium leguminosarum]MBP2446203.1 hypothetical protein [Rhizobium leguminosarum]
MKKQHAVCRRPDELEAAIGKTQIAQSELREIASSTARVVAAARSRHWSPQLTEFAGKRQERR